MHAHGRPVAISLCMFLVACSSGFRSYELNGVGGKFCVPVAYEVAGVDWVADVVPDSSSSFAFAGCWRLNQGAPSGCGFPPEVISGLVSSSVRFRGWRWESFAADTLIMRVLSSKNSTFMVDSGQEMVAVGREGGNAEWYVWKIKKYSERNGVAFSDGDELLAICSRGVSTAAGVGAGFDICNRRVRGKEYSVEYSFESHERFPRGIEQLDADVLRRIESWRCPRDR
jgi:hypothetical protein